VSDGQSGDRTALLVIDMLNAYDHEDADMLTRSVDDVVGPIARLVARARDEDALVVWVNDNYSDWSSGPKEIADRALAGRRRDLVEPVLPLEGAPFVMKPRHTVFYETPLDYLLYREQVGRIVLTGQVTEQCILYSALDAYVRHFAVAVPSDAVAHIHEHLARASIDMMERNMHAEITTAADCSL
jgi:nicotinamidase-related amidase